MRAGGRSIAELGSRHESRRVLPPTPSVTANSGCDSHPPVAPPSRRSARRHPCRRDGGQACPERSRRDARHDGQQDAGATSWATDASQKLAL
jgi:hypothetical protein